MKYLNMKKKRSLAGWLFIMPWLIGLIIFFIQPAFNFLIYSFGNFKILSSGGYELKPLEGSIFTHYINAWTTDATYPLAFTDAFRHFSYEVPIIVFFSLFVAIILNQNFRGRTIMRAIFFLPIIITSGVLGLVIGRDISAVEMGTMSGSGSIYDVTMLTDFLVQAGLPDKIIDTLTGIVGNVADLVWKSGVQILIFLIGLLSIPSSYYEAATVEGATGWETFWKITFPIVSPFILANIIFTLISSCMEVGNGVIIYVLSTATESFNYSYASAMMWMYFLVILVIVAAVFLICSRFVFYGNQIERRKKRGQ